MIPNYTVEKDLSDKLVALQDSGASLTGAEQDFIASFERMAMDKEDGVADEHYSGFDLAVVTPGEAQTPIARAHQILNSHHAATV